MSAKMYSFPVDDGVSESFDGCLVEPPIDFAFAGKRGDPRHGEEGYVHIYHTPSKNKLK